MKVELIDIGANLTHTSFAPDLELVISRAVAVGVTQQIVTGADLGSSKQAFSLTEANPQTLFSTAGIHPHHAGGFDPSLNEIFFELLSHRAVVAVGECGLDYFRDIAPRSVQRAAFIAQLEMAAKVRKPVFLHQREAHHDFLAIMKEHRANLVGGVAHCFTGSLLELEAYLALDLAIGITGWICDERRGLELRQVVTHIPDNRLMLETDSPYLMPRDLQPKPKSRRNEPSFLRHIAATVATARCQSLQELAVHTSDNARRLFFRD